MTGSLPSDAKAREEYPLAEGLLFYFPAALAEVARVSKVGNDQHNRDQPMHHARWKSTNHADKILRHLVDSAEADEDSDGMFHAAKLAWRALALLQELLERRGAPLAKNARLAPEIAWEDAHRRFVYAHPIDCHCGRCSHHEHG